MSKGTVQKAYRIDGGLYEQVEDTLFKMGMTVPQAITMLFRRVVMEQKLPFTPAIVQSAHRMETEDNLDALVPLLPVKKLDLTRPEDLDEFYAE